MWQTAFTTFVAVFVAELADKTQLATLALAAESPSRLGVFLGSASALVSTSLLAVLAGGAIGRLVPPAQLQRAAGTLFIVLGAWMLWRSGR
jgi:putative Ca2+/H+ antiporter (TMEM165/GDT1 family)